VQCLLVFLALLCVFTSIACLMFGGINNAFLASTIIIPSSNNIATSLCYNVDRLILVVGILRYDCKFALNIVVRKLSMVGTCKP